MNKFMMNNYDIVKLNGENFYDLQCLFSECFENDPYYSKIFSNASVREELSGPAFSSILSFCLNKDGAYGIYENKKLIAFLLLIDYHKTKCLHTEYFETIFIKYFCGKELPYIKEIHNKISRYEVDVIYLLSIGVSKNFRRRGIAKKLIDFTIEKYQNSYIVGDVSNVSSITLYKERNFECEKIDDDYFLVIRKPI